ncbi:hypothetical protein [Morganella morganii]|uniref:hypothetical protein n=1 Tax=Morganella morganii TaxID=582 RepID=UPI00046ABBD7|nr:hypothetical protein [Morganella morganii]
MSSFFEQNRITFDIVCRLLGNGWRVNLLDDCQYRIKLSSPELKGFIITARPEKGRLKLCGFVDSRLYRGQYFTCSLSLSRNTNAIAQAIERKILPDAPAELEKVCIAEKREQDALYQDKIIKGMLSRLVKLESHYNAFTGFKSDNGLHGCISEHFDGYGLTVRGLSVDQLIRLSGLINSL